MDLQACCTGRDSGRDECGKQWGTEMYMRACGVRNNGFLLGFFEILGFCGQGWVAQGHGRWRCLEAQGGAGDVDETEDEAEVCSGASVANPETHFPFVEASADFVGLSGNLVAIEVVSMFS